MNFQKCTYDDWQAVQHFARSTFIHTYAHKNKKEHFDNYLERAFNDARIQKELQTPGVHYYFAKKGKETLGYIKLNEAEQQSDLNRPNTLEVERIYVLPEFKGQGIGRQLIDKAAAVARAKNISTIWLGVWEHNPDAILFYQKMGFVQTGTHDFMMGDDLQTDFVLEKKVLP